MSKVTNPEYWFKETPDCKIETGKVNNDNLISGFKVTNNIQSPDPHYMQLDRTGPAFRKGGTICRGPGAFQIKHGTGVEDGMFGVVIDSGNGDMHIKCGGRLKIEAAEIEIMANKGGGNIQIDANNQLIINANSISANTKGNTTIVSENTVELIGKSILNIYGGLVEVADGASFPKGSDPFPTARELLYGTKLLIA